MIRLKKEWKTEGEEHAEHEEQGDKFFHHIFFLFGGNDLKKYTIPGSAIEETVLYRPFIDSAREFGYNHLRKNKRFPRRKEHAMKKKIIAVCLLLALFVFSAPGVHALREVEDMWSETADAYVFRLEDGMPKYWLDLTGMMEDDIVLHSWTLSEEETWTEQVYVLSLDSADVGERTIDIYRIDGPDGEDLSDSFLRLTILLDDDGAMMIVRRVEEELDGEEADLPTGIYEMERSAAALVYQCRDDEGALQYWLNQNGDDLELHGLFPAEDGDPVEEVFLLDTDTAEYSDHMVRFTAISTADGEDISECYRSLQIYEMRSGIRMSVRQNSGKEDGEIPLIPSGSYTFEPYTYLIPEGEGPFGKEDLGRMAQQYYLLRSGVWPQHAEVEKKFSGGWMVHLYNSTEGKYGAERITTLASWTVDDYGIGVDEISDGALDLRGAAGLK